MTDFFARVDRHTLFDITDSSFAFKNATRLLNEKGLLQLHLIVLDCMIIQSFSSFEAQSKMNLPSKTSPKQNTYIERLLTVKRSKDLPLCTQLQTFTHK